MKVTVCIGSSCHIKGSRIVVEKLQQFINEEGLGDKVNSTERFAWINVNSACALRLTINSIP